MSRGRNLEWKNLERPIFRNFKISNIKITKDELFDFYCRSYFFNFLICTNYSNTWNVFLKLEIFGILIVFQIVKLSNLLILEIVKFSYFPNWKFLEYSKLEIYEIFLIKKLTNFQNFFSLENYQNSKNWQLLEVPFDII